VEDYGVARRVRIYLSEADSWHHQPTHRAILDLLRREASAGATVFKGVEGFGAGGQIHTAGLVDLAGALPLVVEWIDTPERVQRRLPRIVEMVPGLITVEDVRVAHAPRRALRDVSARLLVQDVMTPAARVAAVAPDTALPELVALLLRERRNAVPVVDGDRRVVGIITNSDLVRRAGLPLRLELLRALGRPEEPAVARQLAGLQGEGHAAAAIMTPGVVTVGPALPLAEAAQIMLERRLKRLPVVDEERHLLGMVSRFDILQSASDSSARPEDAAASAAGGGGAPRRIGEVMNRRVPTVRPEATLPEVLDAVMATRLHSAVVVDDAGRPLGGIVDTDLMQRVTPAAHPGLVEALMRRVRPTSPAEREAWQQRTGQRAADVMRPREQLLVVAEDADIPEVIARSLAQGIKLVVVVDGQGRVVGMVDRADLLAALATAD